MATTDPFQRGGGTSSGSGGALPGDVQPPFQGPRSQTGQPKGGKGPYGGRIGGEGMNGGGRKGGR